MLPFARLRRNNVGKVKDENGQYHVFGLGVGSPDLVGWVKMETGIARVFCIEVKREKGGVTSDAQIAYLTSVNRAGGAGAVCRDRVTAIEFAHRARAGELFAGAGPYSVK